MTLPLDLLDLAEFAGRLYPLAQAMLLTAVGAIIGGRLCAWWSARA